MNKGLKNKGLGSWFCLAAALVALITGIVFLLTQATAAPLGHSGTMAGVVLLVGAAEVVLRRWRSLSWHLPLLLLMGVMITAPANNFERHMLPVAFVFGFVCLQFWRESRNARSAASANVASAHEASQVRQDE